MKGNNLVMLRGHLGGDPQSRALPSGTIVELSLATNNHWRDDQGQLQERTDWHRVSVHGPTAEWAARALHRGDHVMVLGALRHRSWTHSDGSKRSAVSIRAWEVQRLGKSRVVAPGGRRPPANGTDGRDAVGADALPF